MAHSGKYAQSSFWSHDRDFERVLREIDNLREGAKYLGASGEILMLQELIFGVGGSYHLSMFWGY